MDLRKYYDITHRHHQLCNPMSTAKMNEVCDLLRLDGEARVLDIGCGKAKLLVGLAEQYGVTGIGVDLSPHFIRDARQRHLLRAPGASLEFVCQDGADYRPDEPESFDLAICMGASWIWDGHRGTLRALLKMTKPGGLILVGEPFWIEQPQQKYLDMTGMREEDVGTHHGNVRTGEDEGLLFLYSAVSSLDEWDRYEGLQWYAAAEYAREHPHDPDLPEIVERLKRSRDSYLRWGRDCLGWAAYLFRRPR